MENKRNWLEHYSLENSKFNGLNGLPICTSIDKNTGFALLTNDVDPRYSVSTKLEGHKLDDFFRSYAIKRFGKRVLNWRTVSSYEFFNPDVFSIYNFETIDTFSLDDIKFLNKYNILMTPLRKFGFYFSMGLGIFLLILGIILGSVVDIFFFIILILDVFVVIYILCLLWTRDVSQAYYNYVRSAKYQPSLRRVASIPYGSYSHEKYNEMQKFLSSVFDARQEKHYPYMMSRATFLTLNTGLSNVVFQAPVSQLPIPQQLQQYQSIVSAPQAFSVPGPVTYQPMGATDKNNRDVDFENKEAEYYPTDVINPANDETSIKEITNENYNLPAPTPMFF